MEKPVTVFVVILLLAAAALLLMDQNGPDNIDNVSEMRDKIVYESNKVSSYSYRSLVTTVSKGFLEDVKVDVKSVIEGNGSVDLENRFMYTPVSINIVGYSGGTSIKTESRMEMYISGDTLYTKAKRVWVKQKLKGDSWNKTQLKQYSDAVENAYVKLIGTEELGGEPVYVLEFKPGLDEFMDYAVELKGNAPSLDAKLSEETIRGYTIMAWVSTESLLPLKTTTEFTLVSGDVTTTMKVVNEYYDYNKPVNPQLPEEVASAIEM